MCVDLYMRMCVGIYASHIDSGKLMKNIKDTNILINDELVVLVMQVCQRQIRLRVVLKYIGKWAG